MLAAGHSLGGALATLAAFDIRRHLLDNMQSNAEVVCYTFAAPRTGNHAFAREYNAMVPDTWSVINDQVSLRLCLVSTPSHQPSNQSRASVKLQYCALESRLRLHSPGVCKVCVINARHANSAEHCAGQPVPLPSLWVAQPQFLHVHKGLGTLQVCCLAIYTRSQVAGLLNDSYLSLMPLTCLSSVTHRTW